VSAAKIVERQVGDVTVLDVHGALRFGESENMLRDAVSRLLDSGKRKVLVNLADVSHMDSAGLGEVVRCYATVSRAGGAMKLVNLTAKIRDLLTITKLLTVFETYDSEELAVRSFPS
jgi:anti-sigma B factor antagonist